MLPYNIFNSVKISSIHNELIKFIYENSFLPLSAIVIEFCDLRKWSYGKLMYYMKDLELYGLIDISDSTRNPIINVSYFEKFSIGTYFSQ